MTPIPARPLLLAAAASLLFAGCAGTGPAPGSAGVETLVAATADNRLLTFHANAPQTLLAQVAVTGLEARETLIAIDVRPANGLLYGATSTGRLVTLDPRTGAAQPVGGSRFNGQLRSEHVGFDFNPVVDRIRVVDATGTNLRLHPDTGAVVDADPKVTGLQLDTPLQYAMEDPNEGKPARVTGAGYTRGAGAKWTTNYAIDSAQATLVTQGVKEGDAPAKPPVSPNAGLLFTVGPLGVRPGDEVGFDVAHEGMAAYATFGTPQGAVLHSINLATGAATAIGPVGRGERVRGLAILPAAGR